MNGMRRLDRRLVWPLRAAVTLLVVVAMVAACGGGGGSPQTTTPPPPPPPCVQTVLGCLTETQYETKLVEIEDTHNGEDDFKNQWGLTAVRADRAWAQLELEYGIGTAPGSGQTVGVIDTGIDTGHPVFCRQDGHGTLLFRGGG